jgi:signal transduction histidine kinase
LEGSHQTEQELLRELSMLRLRVADLEQALIDVQSQQTQKHDNASVHVQSPNELALLEANRRMDEFLSIASHELRTPLTTINGNIQLAKRRVKALPIPPQAPPTIIEKISLIEELLNRAERQVRVQNRMVSDLLDVSRIQANRLDLNLNSSDLAVIVREVIEDQRSSSGERITLSSDIPDDLKIPIVADADRIAQVITNFLTNALKYSAPDLPVEVQIQTDAHSARVSVRDQGPGLPLDEQEKLWERFYRVPGIVVQSGSGVGLGLGLHICRIIVERHNGHVGVESSIGQGSTFWFSLPLTTVPCDQPV